VLEATRLATDTKLWTIEASVARIDNNLASLLRAVPDSEHRGHQVLNQQNTHPNCRRPIHHSCCCCYALDAGRVLVS
jgi:hypothetical protein